MLLKNHLIEVFKKASLENDILLKENIVLKWVHRFGIDSLNDLLIQSSLPKENQEQISLINEVNEEENQKKLNWESTVLQTSRSNEIISKNQESNKIKQYTHIQKSPLPYIKNLRKWINTDKKAS